MDQKCTHSPEWVIGICGSLLSRDVSGISRRITSNYSMCGDFTAADAQEDKLLQLRLPLIWSQNPFCSGAFVKTKPLQHQDLFLPTLFHLVTTMSPSKHLFHLKLSSHAYLKTLISETSKPMCTLTNTCRDLQQLFQPHRSWILQINTKAFSKAHCLLV